MVNVEGLNISMDNLREMADRCDKRTIVGSSVAVRDIQNSLDEGEIDQSIYNRMLNNVHNINNEFLNNCSCFVQPRMKRRGKTEKRPTEAIQLTTLG